jgi:uncharacterized alkaline shock family protein YloU
MQGHASISGDVVARYAADAARDVAGVRDLVGGHLPRQRGVRVDEGEGATRLEVHLQVDWGASIPDVGRDVQRAVRDYVEQMTDRRVERVDVVVEDVGAP